MLAKFNFVKVPWMNIYYTLLPEYTVSYAVHVVHKMFFTSYSAIVNFYVHRVIVLFYSPPLSTSWKNFKIKEN